MEIAGYVTIGVITITLCLTLYSVKIRKIENKDIVRVDHLLVTNSIVVGDDEKEHLFMFKDGIAFKDGEELQLLIIRSDSNEMAISFWKEEAITLRITEDAIILYDLQKDEHHIISF